MTRQQGFVAHLPADHLILVSCKSVRCHRDNDKSKLLAMWHSSILLYACRRSVLFPPRQDVPDSSRRENEKLPQMDCGWTVAADMDVGCWWVRQDAELTPDSRHGPPSRHAARLARSLLLFCKHYLVNTDGLSMGRELYSESTKQLPAGIFLVETRFSLALPS